MTEVTPLDLDEALTFAMRLRGDPVRMNDQNGGTRQNGLAASPFKLYGNAPRIRLEGSAPWWLSRSNEPVDDDMLAVGALLAESAGVTRVRWQPGGTVLSSPQHPRQVWPERRLIIRRSVPSGGAMYPCEIYVASADESGSELYHYDPARHELSVLATRCPSCALREALGFERSSLLERFAIVLTHHFAKNLHKYGNFAYRLGAVDVGVVVGRLLACARERFETVGVRFDFDDATLNDSCGLRGTEESAYAVVLLGAPRAGCVAKLCATRSLPLASPTLKPVDVARPSRLFAAMHAAASSPGATIHGDPGTNLGDSVAGEDVLVLPPPAVPSDAARRRALTCRTSNGAFFSGEALQPGVLSAVLNEVSVGLELLRTSCADRSLPAVRVFCAVQHVRGIEPGWYRYLPERHGLTPNGSSRGSPARALQRALHLATVDAERAAFTVHFAVELHFSGKAAVRAYRVRRLLVGAAIDAVTRVSAALDAGSHPLLGFDADEVDRHYNLVGTPFGVEAEVLVGAARPNGVLEGSVVS